MRGGGAPRPPPRGQRAPPRARGGGGRGGPPPGPEVVDGVHPPLGVGGALALSNPPEPGTDLSGALFLGARVRIFVVPNAAIFGTLGGSVIFVHGLSSFVIGAPPLGAAGLAH